jgi:hypothetical protein
MSNKRVIYERGGKYFYDLRWFGITWYTSSAFNDVDYVRGLVNRFNRQDRERKERRDEERRIRRSPKRIIK